jgi:hypothetical protein
LNKNRVREQRSKLGRYALRSIKLRPDFARRALCCARLRQQLIAGRIGPEVNESSNSLAHFWA